MSSIAKHIFSKQHANTNHALRGVNKSIQSKDGAKMKTLDAEPTYMYICTEIHTTSFPHITALASGTARVKQLLGYNLHGNWCQILKQCYTFYLSLGQEKI